MRAVRNEKLPSTCTPASRNAPDFLQKREGIKHNTVADYAAAACAQHSARHNCRINFLPLMMTVWPALCPPA